MFPQRCDSDLIGRGGVSWWSLEGNALFDDSALGEDVTVLPVLPVAILGGRGVHKEGLKWGKLQDTNYKAHIFMSITSFILALDFDAFFDALRAIHRAGHAVRIVASFQQDELLSGNTAFAELGRGSRSRAQRQSFALTDRRLIGAASLIIPFPFVASKVGPHNAVLPFGIMLKLTQSQAQGRSLGGLSRGDFLPRFLAERPPNYG